MRSPADMEFIQIDITNACNMRCSNCTRFCGNHAKPFFMDFDTFKRAVDSLDGFEGVTGIIGGEPTLHPEFERFARYMREKYGEPSGGDRLLYPQSDFIHSVHLCEFDSEKVRERSDGSRYMKKHGAGLWSNMSATYRKYYEVIQDTFSVQYLNDHLNPSYHQPGLFSRKDLNIPDDEWFRLRDKCWIQNTWSATITPKGAFFCEIAAALDMLFDGPGGWKIEPGWWKRKPEDFADQMHWCEICGFALEGRTFTRDSQEETDDVSPTVFEMLKKTGSPKLKSGHINAVKIENGVISDSSKPEDKRFVVGNRYIAKYEDRFQEKNSVLFQIDYDELVIADGEEFGSELVKVMHGDHESSADWVLLKHDRDTDISDLESMIGRRVFNPGVLHEGRDYLFFCKGAISLRELGYDRLSHLMSVLEFKKSWNQGKIINISEIDRKTDLKRESLKTDARYAIWGAGMLGENFAEMVELSGGKVVLVIDKAEDKTGKLFAGVEISVPEKLAEQSDTYDYLLIAHHLKFEDIKRDAVEMGIPEEKIIMPYEV